jgi:ABC-type dipeptide/oligopeptide/nickel transport system ATPase component
VLQKGKIVEQARTSELFEQPQQPYTRQLLQSIPGRALRVNAT